MKYVIFAAALLVPSGASAQVTTYIPGSYGGGILYQYGPRGTSITNTIPNGYGGFTQYHYGPGRAPQFVQPLPTPSYAPAYAPLFYGGYRPYHAPQPMRWNNGFGQAWGAGPGMGAW
ncbi:MAG: hypothetical protein AB7O68_10170 [Pirellulales bacterium]